MGMEFGLSKGANASPGICFGMELVVLGYEDYSFESKSSAWI